MGTLFCPNCRDQVEFYTELKSTQNTARCIKCNTFIKNIPYEKPMLYVGKYAKKPIDEIDDLSYLIWAFKNMKLSARLKDAISKQISHLEYLLK